MANSVQIGGKGTLFVGEDKTLRLELLTPQYDAAGNLVAPSSSSVPVDMSGFAMIFDVRLKDNSAAPAIFSGVPTVTGVYNASRAVNTQRAVLVLTAANMNLFKGQQPDQQVSDLYRYSWKRTDSGAQTVLAWGPFAPQKATAA